MNPLPLPNLEEVTVLLDVVREQVRRRIEQKLAEAPEQSIIFIPFEEIEELNRLADEQLMVIVMQLELYNDLISEYPELTAQPAVVRFFYVSRRVEVFLPTEQLINTPEVRLAKDVAMLIDEKASTIKSPVFDFTMPTCVLEHYEKEMDVRQRENFRVLLREYLSLVGLSITGRFLPSFLKIERNE